MSKPAARFVAAFARGRHSTYDAAEDKDRLSGFRVTECREGAWEAAAAGLALARTRAILYRWRYQAIGNLERHA